MLDLQGVWLQDSKSLEADRRRPGTVRSAGEARDAAFLVELSQHEQDSPCTYLHRGTT